MNAVFAVLFAALAIMSGTTAILLGWLSGDWRLIFSSSLLFVVFVVLFVFFWSLDNWYPYSRRRM